MDKFLKSAEEVVVYQIRSVWHELSRMYNELAASNDTTMAIGFTLLTIHPEKGTQVTKIAPRMGMEPNSLSRLLKSMEAKGLITRVKDDIDKRKVYVCLTKEGKIKRAYAEKAVFRFNEALLSSIDPEKAESFFEFMGHIKETAQKMKEIVEEEK
ncbi:MarR family transcriptional regulator [bacterium]|nr:MarR family transcriptional regulator [bacterium]